MPESNMNGESLFLIDDHTVRQKIVNFILVI